MVSHPVHWHNWLPRAGQWTEPMIHCVLDSCFCIFCIDFAMHDFAILLISANVWAVLSKTKLAHIQIQPWLYSSSHPCYIQVTSE